MYVARMVKISLVASAALLATLVAFNNITDYDSNFQFVRHVLMMDTTFPDNKGMWRRLEHPALHHLAYVLIIAWECAVAVVCWIGAVRLWSARLDPRAFNAAKGPAIAGLGLGIGLWFTGFVVIGAEWFLMWQSSSWNGQESAARFALLLGVILLYVSAQDPPEACDK
ncbi:MAG: DUF2165 domain-containing protein [Haliea sp.]|uniref:DUF2165 family protein n=1 Tax=Haliea sp. TaxID=1932666 RepID=UPI0032EF96EE